MCSLLSLVFIHLFVYPLSLLCDAHVCDSSWSQCPEFLSHNEGVRRRKEEKGRWDRFSSPPSYLFYFLSSLSFHLCPPFILFIFADIWLCVRFPPVSLSQLAPEVEATVGLIGRSRRVHRTLAFKFTCPNRFTWISRTSSVSLIALGDDIRVNGVTWWL